MNLTTSGIHHVTAINRDAQQHVDFWTAALGLRLVKLTLNFDTGDAYHLFFGDETGRPGSVHTVFPYPNARTDRPGAGQFGEPAFAVLADQLDDWIDRLWRLGSASHGPVWRCGAPVVSFADPDGLAFELVGVPDGQDGVSGFESVGLLSREPEQTVSFLTGVMGFRIAGEEGERLRFLTGTGGSGARLDLIRRQAPRARGGVGTIHHVAWRVEDAAGLAAWREHLLAKRVAVTPIKDRKYFKSIYFREPGGALFELATDGPGFTLDESPAELGSDLRLPPAYEGQRAAIEHQLPVLTLPSGKRVPASQVSLGR